MPGWVGPTAALSLLVIAASFVAIALAVVFSLRGMGTQVQALHASLEQLKTQVAPALEELRAEMVPALQALRRMADEGREAAALIRSEAGAIVRTSRGVRRRVVRGVRELEDRFDRLTALYDVVSHEVEGTALDLTDRLRGLRRGTSVIGQLRRLVRARRRA